MDKQTLSNYGWLVIVALILAVMLAFATPFGTYVGDGVVSIANGFVGTSDEAIDEDNISKLEDKWANKLGNTDGTPVCCENQKLVKHGDDKMCTSCDTVVYGTTLHAGIIPEGAEYHIGYKTNADYGTTEPLAGCNKCGEWCVCDVEILKAGQAFPANIAVGDAYFYEGYAYLYGFKTSYCPFSAKVSGSNYILLDIVTLDGNNVSGWEIAIANGTSSYNYNKIIPQCEILSNINGLNVTNMSQTFMDVEDYSAGLPQIPHTVTSFSMGRSSSIGSQIMPAVLSIKLPCHLNTSTDKYLLGSDDAGLTCKYATAEHYHYSGCGH